MREAEVRVLIGNNNWDAFLQWHTGQTYGIYPDGTANFYPCDVDAFKRKLDTGYDRQGDPIAWD